MTDSYYPTAITYSDLMTASGTMRRAAEYLLASYSWDNKAMLEAVGILSGLAYVVRPQMVR